MKQFFSVLVIGAMAYFGWSFYHNYQKETTLPIGMQSPSVAVTPAALPLPASSPIVTSTPMVIQSQPTPEAKLLRRLAPEGVFFVLQRLSTTTDSGVASAVPGTKVTLVRDGLPMRVSDGQNEYDALASQLTNDMDVAEKLAQADQSAQARIKQQIFQKSQEYHEQRQQVLRVEDASREKLAENANMAEAERQQKIAKICQNIQDARQAILDYRPYRTYRGRIPIDDQHEQQRFIDKKQREIGNLQNELVKLGVSVPLN